MKQLGISRSTYIRWKNCACITVKSLIRLCNLYNLRVSWFILPNEAECSIPTQHVKMDNPWHFTFNHEELMSYFGNEAISWREASRITGHSRTSLQSWCRETATVDQLLYVLNTFHIPITRIISDNTLRDIECSEYYLRAELLRKQAEITALRAKLRQQELLLNNEQLQFVAEEEHTYQSNKNSLA